MNKFFSMMCIGKHSLLVLTTTKRTDKITIKWIERKYKVSYNILDDFDIIAINNVKERQYYKYDRSSDQFIPCKLSDIFKL